MNDLTLLDLFLNDLWIGKGLSPNTVQSYRLDFDRTFISVFGDAVRHTHNSPAR